MGISAQMVVFAGGYTFLYIDDVIDNIIADFPSMLSYKEEVIQVLFGNYINNTC